MIKTAKAGVLVLGHGHIIHMVDMPNFFENLFSTAEHRSDKLSIL